MEPDRNRNRNFFKSRNRNRNHNFSKVRTGTRTGTVINSYGSTTLVLRESLLQARSGLEGHTHCNENSIYVFLEKEFRGLSPNFHIHVSVNDLYIPRIG
jgi:hypothetical protein